jgi:hypothetical protein
MKLITIANVLNPADAGLICSRLAAAGFHPFMPDENTAFTMEGYTLAMGGIRIQVTENEAADAKEFLETPGE